MRLHSQQWFVTPRHRGRRGPGGDDLAPPYGIQHAKQSGIRVNAVSCGLVATPSPTEHYGDAEQLAKVPATIPRGVFATPAEFGQDCLLLASPLASHITGAVLNVDGGGEWPSFLQYTPNA